MIETLHAIAKPAAMLFAFGGLVVGLRAARLWWLASNVAVLPDTSASISDVPELYTMALQASLIESANLNKRAAKWTAGAVGLSALVSFFSIF